MQRQILRLAIPNILSNLTVPLLGMVDTALMGRMDSEIYLGAIALGGILFNFIYWGFGFLRMGTTGLTAQAHGRSNSTECRALLGRSLSIALIAGILLIILQVFIERLGFFLLTADSEVKSLGRSYYYIRIYAAPATIGLYALTGWFLGMQNARFPLWIALCVNLLNIVFNAYFVLERNMGVEGVAWGTVLAQYIGFVFALHLLRRGFPAYTQRISFADVWESQALLQFFRVNSDIFLRTLCLIGSFGAFVSFSGELGTLILAANQVLLQYFHLLSYGVDGFAYAAESLTGKFKGAEDSSMLRQTVGYLQYWALGIGIGFALLFAVSGNFFLVLFTDQESILQLASTYLPWLVGLSLLGALAFMWDGIFIGLTETRAMRNTMIGSTFLIFLPIAYFGKAYWGNHALWLAMLVFVGARALGLFVVWRRKYG
ncbi:MAG: MATE family efflux transporter [Bacteroidota bacterium]